MTKDYEIKVGSMLIAIDECIMCGDINDKDLTIGKLYQVVEVLDGEGKFNIIDDDNEYHTFGVDLERDGVFEYVSDEELFGETEPSKIKHTVENIVTNMVSMLLYYDRKEDEDLPVGAIEKAIKRGDLSVNDIVNKFREEIEKGIEV